MVERAEAGMIEVGARLADGDLRYWQAKEALRQGEARLASQLAVRTALESRATALTGWSAASLLVLTGAALTAANDATRIAATTTAIVLFLSALIGVHAVRSGDWSLIGYDPSVILDDPLETELEVLESVALGLGN